MEGALHLDFDSQLALRNASNSKLTFNLLRNSAFKIVHNIVIRRNKLHREVRLQIK